MPDTIPSPTHMTPESPLPPTSRMPRVVLVVAGILMVVIVVAAVMLFTREKRKISPPAPSPPPLESFTPSDTAFPLPPADSDGDRLLNEEEVALGTNPFHPDTDNDELFDAAEVRIYKTDPKNPDTDGDGHKDGAEVRAGYNPAGTGKL